MDFDPDAALKELRQEALQRQYGDPLSQVQTFGESFGDTATFGAFGHLLNAVGGDPEGRKKRKEANPAADVAGMVGGVLLPGGAPSLIGKVGGAAARGVSALLPEATTLAGKVGSGALKSLVSGAIEGGGLSAGNVVSELSMDPNLTSQAIADEVGLGTFLGGAVGGGLGALGGLAKGTLEGGVGKKIAEWLPEFEGERNIKAAGALQSDLTAAEAKLGASEVRAIGREAGELGLVQPFDSPAKVGERSRALMKDAGERMGTVLEGAEAAGGKPSTVEELGERIRKEAMAPLGKNPFARSALEGVEDTLAAYEEQFGPSLGLKDLHGIRMNIGDEFYGLSGDKTPAASHAKAVWKKAYGIISEELEKGLAGASKEAGQAWKTANREYQVASSMARFAKKGAQRTAGNNPLGLLSVLSGLTGVATHGVGAGALMGLGAEGVKRYSSSLLAPAARGLRQALEAGVLGAPETVGALTHLAQANEAVAQRIDDWAGKLLSMPKKVTGAGAANVAHLATAQERISQIQRLAANPETMQQALVAHADDLHEHAPNTSQALQIHRARQVAFLNTKVPQMPQTPLGPKLEPTKEQSWRFNRYFDAVEHPSSILEHAAQGTLTPMDVEAVRETAPQQYEQMVTAILSKVTTRKEAVPYRSRLCLSMLCGADLDGTLSQKAILANQAAFAVPSAKSGQDVAAPRPSQEGLGKLSVASRASTPTQAAEMRRSSAHVPGGT